MGSVKSKQRGSTEHLRVQLEASDCGKGHNNELG